MHLISISVTTVAIGSQSIGIAYQQRECIVVEVAACTSFFSMGETCAVALARSQRVSTCAQPAATSFGGLLLGFRCSRACTQPHGPRGCSSGLHHLRGR
jgi:hypothetical protein